MKATIRLGKNRGKEVEVIHWFNGSFSIVVDGESKVFCPKSLLFKKEDIMDIILAHEKGESILKWFVPVVTIGFGEFISTFKERK